MVLASMQAEGFIIGVSDGRENGKADWIDVERFFSFGEKEEKIVRLKGRIPFEESLCRWLYTDGVW